MLICFGSKYVMAVWYVSMCPLPHDFSMLYYSNGIVIVDGKHKVVSILTQGIHRIVVFLKYHQ